MKYVDGFVIPMKKRNIATYRKYARKAGKIWMEYGALEFRETAGEDFHIPGVVSFTKLVKAKRGETVLFSWIVYRSRSHRNRVNAKVMKDPRTLAMIDEAPQLFDPKRLVYSGFEVIVDL